MFVCFLKIKFWSLELENILLPITCYYLVENIYFITLYQLVFNLQIIWSTSVLSAFLLPYAVQSLIINLLVCSEISKHPSLPPFPALLFSRYPTFQDVFSPLSIPLKSLCSATWALCLLCPLLRSQTCIFGWEGRRCWRQVVSFSRS